MHTCLRVRLEDVRHLAAQQARVTPTRALRLLACLAQRGSSRLEDLLACVRTSLAFLVQAILTLSRTLPVLLVELAHILQLEAPDFVRIFLALQVPLMLIATVQQCAWVASPGSIFLLALLVLALTILVLQGPLITTSTLPHHALRVCRDSLLHQGRWDPAPTALLGQLMEAVLLVPHALCARPEHMLLLRRLAPAPSTDALLVLPMLIPMPALLVWLVVQASTQLLGVLVTVAHLLVLLGPQMTIGHRRQPAEYVQLVNMFLLAALVCALRLHALQAQSTVMQTLQLRVFHVAVVLLCLLAVLVFVLYSFAEVAQLIPMPAAQPHVLLAYLQFIKAKPAKLLA